MQSTQLYYNYLTIYWLQKPLQFKNKPAVSER